MTDTADPPGSPLPGEGPEDRFGELVSRARAGDRDAFDELVRETWGQTYALALRLTGDDHDARDVVQEAYLRAYRGLRRFRGDARFTTWLHRITANCASTHLGRRRRHRHVALDEVTHDDAVVMADLEPLRDPSGRAENAELRRRLQVALRQLPPRLRAVVVLRDIYDLPHEEIAEELGISVAAAKVRLHRARRSLRVSLFERSESNGADASAESGDPAVVVLPTSGTTDRGDSRGADRAV